MKKRGLSTVITYVLLILLSIVAISIIFVLVKGILTRESENTKLKASFFNERLEIQEVNFNPSNNLMLNMTLEKLTGEVSAGIANETEVFSPLDVDVISVVDLSGSMKCSVQGGYSNQATCEGLGGVWLGPLESSKESNKQLVQAILVEPEESVSRISLIAYSTEVLLQYSIGLINDVDELNQGIDSWAASDSTCICCGINAAVLELEEESLNDTEKTIIVMSDGEANIECSAQGTGDSKQDAIQAACDANSELDNITIYSVGLGDADEETLEEIADCANGEYYSAETIDDLLDVYKVVAEKIKKEYTDRKFSYLLVRFYDGSGNYKDKKVSVPGTLIPKEYSFDLTDSGLTGSIKKIEVYPVILTSKGEEIVGPLFDYWEKGF